MMILLLSLSSLAATLTVGTGGTYESLQDAVDAASDGDTLLLAAGRYNECVDLGGRSLTIRGSAGSGSTTLDGGGTCEAALALESGETATLEGLTVTNATERAVLLADADVTLVDVVVKQSGSDAISGGGVYVSGGSVSFEDCVLTENEGEEGGNLYVADSALVTLTDTEVSEGSATDGAGIFVDDSVTTLVLDGATVRDNTASRWGGGVFIDDDGTLSSEGSTFDGNTGSAVNGCGVYLSDSAVFDSSSDTYTNNGASSWKTSTTMGGAIYLEQYNTLTMSDATFSGNYATRGGAIAASLYPKLTIEDSVFQENEAYSYGGALHLVTSAEITLSGTTFDANATSAGVAGAIYQTSYGSLAVSECTFTSNTAKSDGGALYVYSHIEVDLRDSTFEENRSSSASGGALYGESYIELSVDDTEFVFNQATSGGALALSSAIYDAELSGVTFEQNYATAGNGGAIYAENTSGLGIDNSIFDRNGSSDSGGAIYSRDSDLILEDSTFEKCWSSDSAGGAIRHYNVGDPTYSLEIDEVEFTGNEAETYGGAIHASNSVLVSVSDSHFEANKTETGGHGGALSMESVSAGEISSSVFVLNSASYGGAIYDTHEISDDDTTGVSNSVFVENDATMSGGALYLRVGYPTIINNTFVTNSALESGGTAHLHGVDVEFVNNLVAFTLSGSGVYANDATSAAGTFTYNDWYENSPDDTDGELDLDTTADGNLEEEPGLAGYDADGIWEDDLRLADGSALIDVGDPSVLDADGSVSDIGAYGGTGPKVGDRDGDASLDTEDCDAGDATVYPGADELCDGLDNDCDETADEDAVDEPSWCPDADGDGYGGAEDCVESCEAPGAGFVEGATDCDDADASASPEGEETAYDGVDQDCSGADWSDVDEDGYDAEAAGGTDCDDADATVFPGAEESAYDGVDQDCSGADLADLDRDGHEAESGGGDDCDDEDADVYAGAPETPYDGVDNDCDGADLTDVDGDGHDAERVGGDDCDDEDPASYAGAPETAYDGVDQDCLAGDLNDLDGDSFASEVVGGPDCDDEDDAISPAAEDEPGDGVDQNCDGFDPDVSVKGWACTGCASSSSPAGPLAVIGALLGLVGLRRRG